MIKLQLIRSYDTSMYQQQLSLFCTSLKFPINFAIMAVSEFNAIHFYGLF
jgi:hypothetical protein